MEDTILKSDIFFVVTTVSVVVLTILIGVLVVYLMRIARDVKNVSRKAKDEAEGIIRDVGAIRKTLEAGGQNIKKRVTRKFSSRKNEEI